DASEANKDADDEAGDMSHVDESTPEPESGVSVQSGSIVFEAAPDPAAAVKSPPKSSGPPPESSAASTQYDMPILNRSTASTGGGPAGLDGTHLGVPVPQEVADAARDEVEAYSDLHGSDVLDAVMEAPTKALDVGGLRQQREQAMSAPTRQVDLEKLRKERSGGRHQKPTGPSHSPLEMPALKLESKDGAIPRAPDPDSVPTRYEMPALKMEDIEKLRQAEQDDSETLEGEDGPDAIATAPERPGVPDEVGPEAEFSETQWFMKGAVVDADMLESVEASEYDRDETIRTVERKKFTLRDVEDDK
ncbi:MAG: hypothetical protein VX938_10125, partial [Myxococcota bacterium]|nr:hypothetical protein [Myxococcota bacterium]